jgi:hypothetical protein
LSKRATANLTGPQGQLLKNGVIGMWLTTAGIGNISISGLLRTWRIVRSLIKWSGGPFPEKAQSNIQYGRDTILAARPASRPAISQLFFLDIGCHLAVIGF